jgi:LmbE family N-acetylglucosaminyl deacetylase
MGAARVAILSPHFDDAALSCASVLLSDASVTVINVFTGVPGQGSPLGWWDHLTGATSGRDRMLERIREDAAVLASCGATVVNLGFPETEYREGLHDVKPLRTDIARALRGVELLYAPAGVGGHPDHLLTRAAGLALRRSDLSVTLYAELPYASELTWPHWVNGNKPDPYLNPTPHIQLHLRDGGLPLEATDAQVRKLDAETLARKIELCRGYATQFPGLDGHFAGGLSQGDRLAYELFWPLGRRPLARRDRVREELLWQAGVRLGSGLDKFFRLPVARDLRAWRGRRRAAKTGIHP